MAACFFAGVRFERERRRIEDEKMTQAIGARLPRVIHITREELYDRTSRLLQGREMRAEALELRGFSDATPRNSP